MRCALCAGCLKNFSLSLETLFIIHFQGKQTDDGPPCESIVETNGEPEPEQSHHLILNPSRENPNRSSDRSVEYHCEFTGKRFTNIVDYNRHQEIIKSIEEHGRKRWWRKLCR